MFIEQKDNRYVLDTPEKILYWINKKFEEQEEKDKIKTKEGKLLYPIIDLSNCIIGDKDNRIDFVDVLKENDQTKNLDCFVNNGYGNKFYHEILESFRCDDSLVYGWFTHNVKFHKRVSFIGSVFKSNTDFSNSLFDEGACFSGTTFEGGIDFSRCEFNSYTIFDNIKFDGYRLNFAGSIFQDDFSIRGIAFLNEKKNKKLSDYRVYISFEECKFIRGIDFSENNIPIDCDFTESEFKGESIFESVDFEKSLIFQRSKILGHLYFSRTDNLSEEVEVSKKVRRGKISFRNVLLKGRLDIEHCHFKELNGDFMNIDNQGILRISGSGVSNMRLNSLINNGVLIFDNENDIGEITLDSAISRGILNTGRTLIKAVKDRETARLIKDSAIKNNNFIDAIEYKAKEIDLYKIDKDSNKIPGTSFLLWLNKWSNYHGLRWRRGIWFTLGTSLGFYLLFLFIVRIDALIYWTSGEDVEWTAEGDILNYFKFLWPTDFSGIIESNLERIISDSSWSNYIQVIFAAMMFVIGKIVTSYGIYQTISAFRKYGK